MEFRSDIQVLRGCAVLLVIFYHFGITGFGNGFLGVDVFFVISGYLMARLYAETEWHVFYRRRLARLLPAALCTILLTLVASSFLLLPVDFSQVAQQAVFASAFLSNVFYWRTDSYFDVEEFRPILHFWSLAVEMQTYAVLPAIFFLAARKRWTLLAIGLVSFLGCMLLLHVSAKTSFFLTPFRIWEFLLGAAVIRIERFSGVAAVRCGAVRALALTLLVYALFFHDVAPREGSFIYGHPGLAALIVTAATSFLILARLPASFCASIAGTGLQKVGDYSYSLYLYHFPVIVLLSYEPFQGTKLGPMPWAVFAATVLATIVLSVCSYHLIERGAFYARNRVRLTSAAALALVASIPVLPNINGAGFTDRQQKIFAAWEDKYVNRCGKVFRILHPFQRVCDLTSDADGSPILLIGNSHADAIKRAFADSARGKASLLFYVEVDVLFGSISVEEIVADVAEKRVGKVVIHYSNVYRNANRRARILQLIDRLGNAAVEVSVIGPVPTYGRHVPQMLYEETRGRGAFGVQTLESHRQRTREFQEFKRELGKRDVEIYDPALRLCSASQGCRVQSQDGTPYYFDNMHLTLTGARELAPIFEAIVNDPPGAPSAWFRPRLPVDQLAADPFAGAGPRWP